MQNVIIDNFMMENLKRYREKMDKYRENIVQIKQDKKVFF